MGIKFGTLKNIGQNLLGGNCEGGRRDSFKAPEGYWSEITMSILDSEWAARRVEQLY